MSAGGAGSPPRREGRRGLFRLYRDMPQCALASLSVVQLSRRTGSLHLSAAGKEASLSFLDIICGDAAGQPRIVDCGTSEHGLSRYHVRRVHCPLNKRTQSHNPLVATKSHTFECNGFGDRAAAKSQGTEFHGHLSFVSARLGSQSLYERIVVVKDEWQWRKFVLPKPISVRAAPASKASY